MANAQILSWGECEIKITPIEGSGAKVDSPITFPTPVEGTANLTTTQGDKTEAKVEGGAVMAVRYGANTYELTFDIRMHSTLTTLPLDGKDGIVPGEFKVEIKPKDNEAAPGVTIARAACNVQVAYTSEGGVVATYTFSSLKTTDGTNQITVGVIL